MDPKLASAIGATARAARHERHLTQEDVAEMLGLATEVYGRLERGKMLPSVETLTRLVTVLGVSADALLGLNAGAAKVDAKAQGAAPVPAHLRRLLRTLGRLDRRQVRLVGLVASEFGSKQGPRRSRA